MASRAAAALLFVTWKGTGLRSSMLSEGCSCSFFSFSFLLSSLSLVFFSYMLLRAVPRCRNTCSCQLTEEKHQAGVGGLAEGAAILAVCCLALAHIRHAMLLYVVLRLHTYVMRRCCMLSCACTHTSCHAAVCSLALAHIRHARLL